MPRNLEDGLLRAAVDVERDERVMPLERSEHRERIRGDGSERVNDIDGELEGVKSEVNARRDDAVERLDGAFGYACCCSAAVSETSWNRRMQQVREQRTCRKPPKKRP